jgi:hypothetical protein
VHFRSLAGTVSQARLKVEVDTPVFVPSRDSSVTSKCEGVFLSEFRGNEAETIVRVPELWQRLSVNLECSREQILSRLVVAQQ